MSAMRNLFAYSILLSMLGLSAMVAQDKKGPPPTPKTLVFEAKNGKVTYDHAAHGKREKNDCKVCHPTPFAQDQKAPLNYKGAMHKAAEDKKASCGMCHNEGGKAFAAKGNCAGKCHNNAAKKG
jgi:c(7)-type cytochrome triheme protein